MYLFINIIYFTSVVFNKAEIPFTWHISCDNIRYNTSAFSKKNGNFKKEDVWISWVLREDKQKKINITNSMEKLYYCWEKVELITINGSIKCIKEDRMNSSMNKISETKKDNWHMEGIVMSMNY